MCVCVCVMLYGTIIINLIDINIKIEQLATLTTSDFLNRPTVQVCEKNRPTNHDTIITELNYMPKLPSSINITHGMYLTGLTCVFWVVLMLSEMHKTKNMARQGGSS